MNQQFIRGRNLLTIIIVFQLLFSILNIYFTFSGTFNGYIAQEFTAMPDFPISSPEALEVSLNAATEENMLGLWLSAAFVIFWSIMLYLGVNWVRLLSGIGWLLYGLMGFVVVPILYSSGFFRELLILSTIIWLLYLIFGGMLLFSPSIRTYYTMMRS